MEGIKGCVLGNGIPGGVPVPHSEYEGLGESSADEDEELVSGDSNFGSLCSSESTEEDASSSSFELSDLMSNLPIKRGLSRYYDGRSQSFTCLGRVTSLEDLIKKDYGSPYKRRMKSSKSYAANIGSDARHCHRGCRSYSPKAMISKKSFRTNSLLRSPTGKGVVSMGTVTGE